MLKRTYRKTDNTLGKRDVKMHLQQKPGNAVPGLGVI